MHFVCVYAWLLSYSMFSKFIHAIYSMCHYFIPLHDQLIPHCLDIAVACHHQVMSNSLRPHGLQHARPPCLSPSLKVCPSSHPLHSQPSSYLILICSSPSVLNLPPHQGLFKWVSCLQQFSSVQFCSVFWMLSFKPGFSLSSFTFIKGLFSSSLLSAIRVVSSVYLRLLIFLPAISIPACASYSPAFCLVYPAYKLSKHSENIQPWHTPFPIWNQSILPCQDLTVAS